MKSESLPAIRRDLGHLANVTVDGVTSPEFEEKETGSGFNIHDLLFMLFRHKWKILFCAAIGLLAAAGLYFLLPLAYESEAKLLVRYVVDRSAIDELDSQIKTPNPHSDTLISDEVQILTSTDLIRQVAEAVGTRRFVSSPEANPTIKANPTINNAVENIYQSLKVSVLPGSNVISVSFSSLDPDLPTRFVRELVNRYFDKHLEVHRSTGAFDFVTQETTQLGKELAVTEAELKQLKERAGIISLPEARSALAADLEKTQQELLAAQADLAAQQARLKNLEKSIVLPEAKQSETPVKPVSGDILQKYQSLVSRVTQLQQSETDLLSRYTSENRMVKVKAAQIEGLEKQRSDMEKKYPALIAAASAALSSGVGQVMGSNIQSERAILAGMESKVSMIKSRMSDLQARAKVITEVEPRIVELERKRDVVETALKHSQASLEKARIDETLDPSRMPNISTVQAPSPPTKVKRNISKLVLGLAGGGLALGIAIALFIELVWDKTVKRSLELEKRLRIPLLLSIPYLDLANRRLRLHDGEENSELARSENRREDSAADENGELLRPFCEAIRDRLGLFFELNGMSHRPKLVAVTGLAKDAGASTLATGLAGALSETAAGKVLLVDKPTPAKKFYNMLADFKGSDLDYVVFDMPSLGHTSSTLPLAGFMDTVLLVVEAEKSDRDAVKRAYTQLAERTKVSVVFNKSRCYGPKWLQGEL
jgi:uncharacterized protein involved in exopolysaccharide biosynthesis/Mrp family chromosome partitioning ATPase